MQISIKLRPKPAAELRGDTPITESTAALIAAATSQGATLESMHPGTRDEELASYFVAEVDDARVEVLMSLLRDHEAIEGAYVKPPDALP
jgi:hypothetical protein